MVLDQLLCLNKWQINSNITALVEDQIKIINVLSFNFPPADLHIVLMDQFPTQMIIIHKILIFAHNRSLYFFFPLCIFIILSFHFTDTLVVLALLTLFHQFLSEIM